jgi:hypothetical protein
MRKQRRRMGSLKAGACGLAAGAAVALGLHMMKPKPERVATTREDVRAAVLVVPEGSGNCRRIMYSNDGPQVLDARVFSCEQLTGARPELPPVLRGYQDALRPPDPLKAR